MLPIFEGGLRRAALQRSWSQYAQARDNYRSTVLSAFQEVEDGLALTAHLRTQARQQAEAVAEARTAQNIAMQLYVDGLTNYLEADDTTDPQVDFVRTRTLSVVVGWSFKKGK